MVKVFGCRQAYENRPSTNPRAACAGLWGVLVLPGRGDGSAGVAMGPAVAWRAGLFARRALDRGLAAADLQFRCRDLGAGRASGHWPERVCCGVRCGQAVPGHDGLLPVGAVS
jgi:hypothetical protein